MRWYTMCEIRGRCKVMVGERRLIYYNEKTGSWGTKGKEKLCTYCTKYNSTKSQCNIGGTETGPKLHHCESFEPKPCESMVSVFCTLFLVVLVITALWNLVN